MESPQPQVPYSGLVDFILRYPSFIKDLAVAVEAPHHELLAAALSSVTEPAQRATAVINALLELEFERSLGEEGSLLRGNSLCTKMVLRFTRTHATGFLQNLLGTWVQQLADTPNEPPKDSIEYNDATSEQALIMQWADAFLDRLLHSVDSFPQSIRSMCVHISSHASHFCPGQENALVGGYLILRLYNPSILAPVENHIIVTEPSADSFTLPPDAKAVLMGVSKLLQHMANDTRFTRPTDACLNDWIDSNQHHLLNHFQEVRRCDAEWEGVFEASLSSPIPPSFATSDIDVKQLQVLHRLVYNARSRLRAISDAAYLPNEPGAPVDPAAITAMATRRIMFAELYGILDSMGPPVWNVGDDDDVSSKSGRFVAGKKLFKYVKRKLGNPHERYEHHMSEVIPYFQDVDFAVLHPTLSHTSPAWAHLVKLAVCMMYPKLGVPMTKKVRYLDVQRANKEVMTFFVASDAVTWLKANLRVTVDNAVHLMQTMVHKGLLHRLGPLRNHPQFNNDFETYEWDEKKIRRWDKIYERKKRPSIELFADSLKPVKYVQLVRLSLLRPQPGDGVTPYAMSQERCLRERTRLLTIIACRMAHRDFGVPPVSKLRSTVLGKRVVYSEHAATRWLMTNLDLRKADEAACLLTMLAEEGMLLSVVGCDLPDLGVPANHVMLVLDAVYQCSTVTAEATGYVTPGSASPPSRSGHASPCTSPGVRRRSLGGDEDVAAPLVESEPFWGSGKLESKRKALRYQRLCTTCSVIKVLRGDADDEVRQAIPSFDHVTVFGHGSDQPHSYWSNLIQRMGASSLVSERTYEPSKRPPVLSAMSPFSSALVTESQMTRRASCGGSEPSLRWGGMEATQAADPESESLATTNPSSEVTNALNARTFVYVTRTGMDYWRDRRLAIPPNFYIPESVLVDEDGEASSSTGGAQSQASPGKQDGASHTTASSPDADTGAERVTPPAVPSLKLSKRPSSNQPVLRRAASASTFVKRRSKASSEIIDDGQSAWKPVTTTSWQASTVQSSSPSHIRVGSRGSPSLVMGRRSCSYSSSSNDDGTFLLSEACTYVRALRSSSKSGDGYIAYEEGDIIRVDHQSTEAWWPGMNMANGACGLFQVASVATMTPEDVELANRTAILTSSSPLHARRVSLSPPSVRHQSPSFSRGRRCSVTVLPMTPKHGGTIATDVEATSNSSASSPKIAAPKRRRGLLGRRSARRHSDLQGTT